ncbi:MAG TPA: hypothetical protein VIT23_13405 [Terrimicrobiaceae bacterium]
MKKKADKPPAKSGKEKSEKTYEWPDTLDKEHGEEVPPPKTDKSSS